MNDAARYDGRGHEPPYVTDTEAAERDERERCAAVAESFTFSMDIEKWRDMTKLDVASHVCALIAEAIRNQ